MKYVINQYGKFLANSKNEPIIEKDIGLSVGDIWNQEGFPLGKEYIGNPKEGWIERKQTLPNSYYEEKGFWSGL